MPKLPAVSPEEVLKALLRDGFEVVSRKGGHVTVRHPVTRRRTTLSIHRKDMSVGLLHDTLKQAGISVERLLELLK